MISPPNVLSWEVLVPARALIRPAAHDPTGFFLAGGLPGKDLVQLIHILSFLN